MNKAHLSLLSCLLLGGCGTVFGGTTQNITIDSNVKGVSIFENGNKVCQTPCIFQARRERSEKQLIAKKDGYEDGRIILGSSFNVAALGNITSIEGFTTDLTTGGLWEYAPNSYYINMVRDAKEVRREEMTKKEIRRFILRNYDALRAEARSGKGEHIASLASLSGLENEEIKQICTEAVSATLLAEEIADRYEAQ